MPQHSPPSAKFDLADEETASYRGLSSFTVVGLLAGLASPLAMFYVTAIVFPVAAVIASALALRQIAVQAPNLAGRKAALAGLFLGLMFLVAAPVDAWVYRYYLRREARLVAAAWIEDIRDGAKGLQAPRFDARSQEARAVRRSVRHAVGKVLC